jgi:hypothetical protein
MALANLMAKCFIGPRPTIKNFVENMGKERTRVRLNGFFDSNMPLQCAFLHALRREVGSEGMMVVLQHVELTTPFPWMAEWIKQLRPNAPRRIVASHAFPFQFTSSLVPDADDEISRSYEVFWNAAQPAVFGQHTWDECFQRLNVAAVPAAQVREMKMFLWTMLCHEVVDVPSTQATQAATRQMLAALRDPAHQLQLLFAGSAAAVKVKEIRLFECLLDPTVRVKPPAVPAGKPAAYVETTDLEELLSGAPADRGKRHRAWATVALVLGLPAESNHLWYALFEPKRMEGTLGVGSYSANTHNIMGPGGYGHSVGEWFFVCLFAAS